jgi:dCMP deaminase
MKQKYKQMYMNIARACAIASTAERLQVGACVVTQSGMVATGLNGTYPGCHTNICELDGSTRPEVRHAERAALDKMLAEGVSAKGASVFITHSPCGECAMALIGAQVKEVYYAEDYRCRRGLELLESAGIPAMQLLPEPWLVGEWEAAA